MLDSKWLMAAVALFAVLASGVGPTAGAAPESSVVESVPVRVDQFSAPGGEPVRLRGASIGVDGSLFAYGASTHLQNDRIRVMGFVRKTSRAGTELWADEFGEPGSARIYAGAVADDGSLFVVGYQGPGREPERDSVGFVRAYSSTGELRWHQVIDDPLLDRPRSIAVDDLGGVYIAGTAFRAGSYTGVLRAYGAESGDERWRRRLATGNTLASVASAQGLVFVTGSTATVLSGQTSAGGDDAFVRAYSPSGDRVWTDQFGTSESDSGTRIVSSSTGALHVLGTRADRVITHSFVRAYDPTGTASWTTEWPIGDQGLLPAGLAVDSGGATYVAGDILVEPISCTPHCSPAVFDGGVLALSDAGDIVWQQQFGTEDNDEVYGVTAGGSGEFHLVGWTEGQLTSHSDKQTDRAFVMEFAPPTCRGLPANVVGTPTGGLVVGTAADDVIVGGIGDDTIHARNGDDLICAGMGHDIVLAGDGDDTVLGQLGDDTLRGGDGDDMLAGNDGHDRLVGVGGRDRLRGGAGDDRLNGGFGPDHMTGGEGDDRLVGSNGDDMLNGGNHRDQLIGGNGDDALHGARDNDVLLGKSGDDDLDGGLGTDRCNGGPGTNTLTACEVER